MLTSLLRKFFLLSWNINHACCQSGILENNSVCLRMQGSTGDLSVPPPILSHLVDGSSNHHDWLTFRLVPFWDLQLSLAWPLTPNTPTDAAFIWIKPRSWTTATVDQCVGCYCYLSQNLSRWYDSVSGSLTPPPTTPSTHTSIKRVSPLAWSKVDLLKAYPNDMCHSRRD